MKQRQIIVCGAAGSGKTTLVAKLREEPHGASGVVPIDTPDADSFGLATAAMASDAAVVIVDAQRGGLDPARRDLHLVGVLRVPRVVVAINRLDPAREPDKVFARLEEEARHLTDRLGLSDVQCIPISALDGANVGSRAAGMSWYSGPTLLDALAAAGAGTTPAKGDAANGSADQFSATVVWTSDRPMLQGRAYNIVAGEASIPATIAPLKYRTDPVSLEGVPARTLRRGDVGMCEIELGRPIVFERYEVDRRRGGYVLHDRLTSEPVGVALLHFALRRSQNVRWQSLDIDKSARGGLKAQKPCIVWFTGLSGAGKSTVANLVEKRLHALGCHTYLLDGDNVRHGLNKDLGFTDADRVENIRRVAEVARLMVDAGLIVLVSFISPFRSERRMARELVEKGEFVEVFVATPLAVAEARDPKGLYKKARRGELKNFTGVDSPYEEPERPELRLDTTRLTPDACANRVLEHLWHEGIIPAPHVSGSGIQGA